MKMYFILHIYAYCPVTEHSTYLLIDLLSPTTPYLYACKELVG